MSTTELNSNSLPVDVVTALYDFQATADDELTINEGQVLYLVEDNRKTEQWALVRTRVRPDAPSGLVPWTYIESDKPSFRASALYSFASQISDEIEMVAGQSLSVYGPARENALVKLDDLNGQVGRVGYVPQSYIKEFQSDKKEELGPISSKDLPERYCSLCEGTFGYSVYYECTQCLLPNGDKYFICQICADDRQACFVHQAIKGQTHLFSRHLPPGGKWDCSVCGDAIEGAKSYFCVSCRSPSSAGFKLCLRCHSNPLVPPHQHPLITISPENLILHSHVNVLAAQLPSYRRYICNGCRREISRYALDCKHCPAPGYGLCLECAETDRATFWHDRWTGGAPHEFRVVDLQLITI